MAYPHVYADATIALELKHLTLRHTRTAKSHQTFKVKAASTGMAELKLYISFLECIKTLPPFAILMTAMRHQVHNDQGYSYAERATQNGIVLVGARSIEQLSCDIGKQLCLHE